MSIAEFPSGPGAALDGGWTIDTGGEGYGGGGGDRTPPQDNEAEQSVLGSMLLSKDAIADVVETVRGTDFYRPAHEVIFDTIVDLYGRGEPADPITVASELQKRGELGKIGGAPYLHTLSASVPIAANAAYYAEIVREKAILRRLVGAGTRIAQWGYSGEGEVDDLVDRSQAEVYAVTDKRTAEDYAPLSEIMEATLDEIEAISNRDGQMVGVPTGFADLDELTNGLHGGQMIIVAARPAMGKALALDTPLPTPSGWTTMGQVQVGDELYDAQGRPTRVVAATEVMEGRPCYEVEFSDGSVIVADAEHQWLTESREARRARAAASIVTTEEIARSEVGDDERVNHSVRNAEAVQGTLTDLPVGPYTLGAWLGAGHAAGGRISSETSEIPMFIEAEGYVVRPLGDGLYSITVAEDDALPDTHARTFPGRLREAGVLGDKHIPAAYLRAPIEVRKALLAGLLDTDGTVVREGGTVQLAFANARLAADAYELIVSLGYTCGRRTETAQGGSEATSVCHILDFSAWDDVFRLHRKQLVHKEIRSLSTAKIGRRYVTRVRPVPSVAVRCVQVDNDEHLYLAGESMIPTHNSTLALDLCRAASIHHNMASVIFSLEMTRNEITMRLLSAEAKIPLNHMRNGHMQDEDWAKLARKMGEVSSAPLFIDDSPNMTMMEIRAKARRLKQRHDLRLIVIDYLQLMSSGKKVESRQLEVSEFSRQIKLLAKELDVPIIALSQLNRGPEQRADKRPMMSDLRESGCVTADTRITRADTNAETTIGELVASGVKDVPVWALDDRLKLVPRTMTHAFPSGVKDVYRIRLTSGREIKATANHPFLTLDGWKPLAELAEGDRIGSIRHVPPPLEITPRRTHEVALLAHLIGGGSLVRRQPIRYAGVDEANLLTVATAARELFGVVAVRDDDAAAPLTTLRLPAPRLAQGQGNPVAGWLDDMGLLGLRSDEKFVPDWVFSLPKEQVALFLRNLWATDGSVHLANDGGGRVSYASTSRRLVDDVARLLLRFNVFGRIKHVREVGHRDCYRLDITGAENQLRFLDDVGAPGALGEAAETLAQHLRGVTANPSLDTVPEEVWDRVRQVLSGKGMTRRESAQALDTSLSGSTMWNRAPSRQRLAKVATVLDDADLEVVATNDVFWDEIAAIEHVGEETVYDATVMGVHNFVANGVPIHNSIEQDADVVILLHREDAYEKESTRPGEADLIVAKHRNGPTRDVVVAFQGHYSRFVDMAHG